MGTTLDLPNVHTASTGSARCEADRQVVTTPFDEDVDKKRGLVQYEWWCGQAGVPPDSMPAVRGEAMPRRPAECSVADPPLAKLLTTRASQTTCACACASKTGPAQTPHGPFIIASRWRLGHNHLETKNTTACSAEGAHCSRAQRALAQPCKRIHIASRYPRLATGCQAHQRTRSFADFPQQAALQPEEHA